MYDNLYHHGIKGQKWGMRRFQNEDGSLTIAGKKRYDTDSDSSTKIEETVSNTSNGAQRLSRGRMIVNGLIRQAGIETVGTFANHTLTRLGVNAIAGHEIQTITNLLVQGATMGNIGYTAARFIKPAKVRSKD